MTKTIEGGCMCGAVRYEISADPLFTAICHCRQCQRQSGTVFSVVSGFPGDAVTLHAATTVFDDVGESGLRVARHFCGACGSPIASIGDALPGVTMIKAGTLDDFGGVTPTMEVYCDRAVPFVPDIPGTIRFPRSNLPA